MRIQFKRDEQTAPTHKCACMLGVWARYQQVSGLVFLNSFFHTDTEFHIAQALYGYQNQPQTDRHPEIHSGLWADKLTATLVQG